MLSTGPCVHGCLVARRVARRLREQAVEDRSARQGRPAERLEQGTAAIAAADDPWATGRRRAAGTDKDDGRQGRASATSPACSRRSARRSRRPARTRRRRSRRTSTTRSRTGASWSLRGGIVERERTVLAHRRQRARHRAAQARSTGCARSRRTPKLTGPRSCASRARRLSLPDVVELRAAMHELPRRRQAARVSHRGRVERDVPRARGVRPIGLAPLGADRDHRPGGDADPRQAAARQARRHSRLPPRRRVQGRGRAADARRAVEGDGGDARRDPRSPLPDDGRHRSPPSASSPPQRSRR